ncbi:hypothetical protein DFA_01563 [Cavenderia fasciculata]|uniref:SIS domain-containing protein n=1 Tax=Cavenderia fasciculata TaxID=261658 RepID=F4PTF5_CACFS|nr:uncharacterized protein DFA_01563 [Cavenderia fasciculata]EGG21677.1 hypothetical protein DFA_01563 [Cavenderia fasciculata]|eukprot:XP_004359527.1 hypothetical protein DFA_01563 [Cavenderia fasciculata]
MSSGSITETANELTGDLDCISSLEMLRLFRSTDAQIFSGYKSFIGMNDSQFIESMASMIKSIRSIVNSDDNESKRMVDFVMSGAGTSGRLAFFVARTFNRYIEQHMSDKKQAVRFNYLIAGGDRSLTVGIEGAEDDTVAAIKDIQSVLDNRKNTTLVYIGITCGFSAPYVAAQIDYLLNTVKGNHIVSLMGFNPLDRARKIKIEQWDRSFNDVALNLYQRALETPSQFFFINPVIGPEPLTGSTRMKSGSATKILLEVLFALSLNDGKNQDGKSDLVYAIQHKFNLYEQAYRSTYRYIDELAPIIDSVGASLKNNGHLYYIASDSMGIVGFIDASETVPTFGAGNLDVRGFILDDEQGRQGWSIMDNLQGDVSYISEQYKISQSHLQQSIIPTITSDDTVLITISPNQHHNLNVIINIIETLNKQSIKPNVLLYLNEKENDKVSSSSTITTQFKKLNVNLISIDLNLDEQELIKGINSYHEMSLKWIYNALTTGGFVLKGKVYGNRMIDLGLTNNKLFYRSCGIVESLMKVDSQRARDCILRAIYSINDQDTIPQHIIDAAIYTHIDHANINQIRHVVPVALLLASNKFQSPTSIRESIKLQPIIKLHLNQIK